MSDTAVRQAYFMGQRHDESFAHFLDTYSKHLPFPTTGPYVSSVTFFAPYALLARLSSQRPYGYSAQQAEIEHRRMVETVLVIVEIQLTDMYYGVAWLEGIRREFKLNERAATLAADVSGFAGIFQR